MDKQKVIYQFSRYDGEKIFAKKEVTYEMKLMARLTLDELCFNQHKNELLKRINKTLEADDENEFLRISELYKQYVRE